MTTLPDASGALEREDFSAEDDGELLALRSITAHNMRLLKAQIVPLIDAALRSSPGSGTGMVDHRRRWTETALRLIDDTAIAALAGTAERAVEPVDFRALLWRAAQRHRDRIGPLSLAALPWLLARRPYLRLLADELFAEIARIAARELPGGLQINAQTARNGGVFVCFRDRDMPEPRPDAPGLPGSEFAARGWSVCLNLMVRMGADFRVLQPGRGRLCLVLRFPEAMLLPADGKFA